MMQTYSSSEHNSGIVAYEAGQDYINVKFSDGAVYAYTSASAGMQKINQMKLLAASGRGLNTFINHHARKGFSRRMLTA